MKPSIDAESGIAAELETLSSQLQFNCFRIKPDRLRRLAKRAALELSPTHRLVVIIQAELSRLLASLAKVLSDDPRSATLIGASAETLREDAALSALRSVAICECLAHGCRGGARCTISHEPVHECARATFFASEDLLALRLKSNKLPPSAAPLVAFARKYLKSFAIIFGDADADVQKLRDTLFFYAGDDPPPPAAALVPSSFIPLGDKDVPPSADGDWVAHVLNARTTAASTSANKTKSKANKKKTAKHKTRR